MDTRTRNRVYWRCQAIGWSLYALTGFFFVVLFPPGPPLWRFAVIYAGAAAIAAGVTHLYRRWLRRRHWTRLSPLPLMPRVGAASVVLGVGITGLISLLYPLMFTPKFLTSAGLSWIYPAVYVWIAAVFVWNVLYFGQHYFEHYREAEVAALRLAVVAKDSNLRALEAQLNPHFIFNCLNSLRGLIGEDPARAQTMVTELASLLRYTLTAERRPTVPLGEELEAVEAYLKLEGIRLEERLRVVLEVEPAALRVPVPAMLVQTLVENGVKHGIAELPEGGELRIAAGVADGRLALQVANSGQLAGRSRSTRVGLDNARERLRLLYDGDASLSLDNDGGHAVVARLTLPLAPPAPPRAAEAAS